jgi:haloalkane dehalogenase
MHFPDYPFEHRYVSVQGLRLHYLDEGPSEAFPVIMLHGNPTWSFYYRKLVSALRDQYRCVVPDHIGMGLSDKPANETYQFTLEQRVDDLGALLDQLNINKDITLVLHDWGGMIGMAYSARFPERIKRLVILNTSAFHLPEGKTLPWQISLGRMPLFGAILIQGFNAFCRGAVKHCVTRKALSKEINNAYLAPYDSWNNRLAIKKFVEDIPLTPEPMLICWGLKDFVFDKIFLNKWISLYPKSEVHSFEDAGHYILEDASEEIVPIIKQFLKKHPL